MKDYPDEPGDQKMGDAHRAAYLIAGYIRHTLTDDERDELDEWVVASDDNMRLFAELTDEKNIEKGLKERNLYDAYKATVKLKEKLKIKEEKKPSKKVRFLSYGIAASVLLLVGLYFLVPLIRGKKPAETITENNNLQPGGDKAVLTLPNGHRIILDTAKGNIIQQGDVKVTNLGGKISYEGKSSEIEYHTLTTPKGGQYKIILSDGTAVWLNAASSLRYPVTFTANERKVELTGEAYFEVAKHPSKRFIVNANNKGEIEVFGTHFNINAYDDEPAAKITLLEGSVKVITHRHPEQSEGSALTIDDSRLISPGQQAVVAGNGQLATNNDIDLDEVVAWKNGLFEFKDEPIESIMRQVARWYDVGIRYDAKPAFHFNATIPRNVPVSKLLHLLELNENVHFTIQDKTIIVKP